MAQGMIWQKARFLDCVVANDVTAHIAAGSPAELAPAIKPKDRWTAETNEASAPFGERFPEVFGGGAAPVPQPPLLTCVALIE